METLVILPRLWLKWHILRYNQIALRNWGWLYRGDKSPLERLAWYFFFAVPLQSSWPVVTFGQGQEPQVILGPWENRNYRYLQTVWWQKLGLNRLEKVLKSLSWDSSWKSSNKANLKEPISPIITLGAVNASNQSKCNKTKINFAENLFLLWFAFGKNGGLEREKLCFIRNYSTLVIGF